MSDNDNIEVSEIDYLEVQPLSQSQQVPKKTGRKQIIFSQELIDKVLELRRPGLSYQKIVDEVKALGLAEDDFNDYRAKKIVRVYG